MNFDSFTGIYQKREYKGKAIPAIINNHSNYYSELQVFEDGIIDCWGLIDFASFEKKLKNGWVVPSIQNDEIIDIHHLGSWRICNGNWLFNSETYYEHIKNVINKLNPQWVNINKYNIEDQIKYGEVSIFGEINHGKSSNTPKVLYGSKEYRQNSFHLFFKKNELDYFLANINVLLYSQILISGIETPKLISNEEFIKNVEEGLIVSEIPINSIVEIYGLGKFEINECLYNIETSQKLLEIKDAILKINDQLTSSEQFYEKYKEYIQNPTESLRKELSIYFEQIPSHLTRYLGDMDSKDGLIRSIIYGNENLDELIKLLKEIGF